MLQLRETSIDDTAVVGDIIYRSYSIMMASAYEPDTLKAVLTAITKPNPTLLSSGKYFIAMETGVGVGCGGWSETVPGGRRRIAGTVHIRHFAVTPEAAGKGVGSLLLDRCLKEAKAEGFKKLQVYSSLNAVSFYEKLGFEFVREIEVPMTKKLTFPGTVLERDI